MQQEASSSSSGSGDDRSEDLRRATEALMATSRLMTAVVARTLSSIEDSVSVPQLRVLVMLRYAEPLNLTAIAEGLGVNASNASRNCDKLAAAGLLLRTEDAADRRHLVVSLAARGRKLVDSLMWAREEVLGGVVAQLSPMEQRRLARGLPAFLEAADSSGLAPAAGGRDSIITWLR